MKKSPGVRAAKASFRSRRIASLYLAMGILGPAASSIAVARVDAGVLAGRVSIIAGALP
jgi:hypothetical protein